MKKGFGKLTRKQVRDVYSILYRAQQEKSSLDEFFKNEPSAKIVRILDATTPWAYFYELPFLHVLSLFLLSITSKAQLKRITKTDDPVQAFIDWANSDIRAPRGFNKWTIEEGALFLSFTMAIAFNQKSLSMFGCYLNDLVGKARKDDDALFDAILVDRSVLASFTAGKRITRAMLENDGEFFDHLMKAIKGTRPKRPEKEYDDLRYMAGVLDESIGLKNISRKKVYDVLVEDLQLYPDTGKDSMKGFEKFIERMLKEKPTRKRK